nr:unnamed protein product [Callosobruchus analis]
MSKRFTTELYADQLAPLYPHLKVSQIKAALILTENNMHECRLILDMKKRFLSNCQANIESKLGGKTVINKQQENEDKFSSCGTSSFTFRASSSSAYNGDISGSVSDIMESEEKPQDQKVGVIIIRNNEGYKACLL